MFLGSTTVPFVAQAGGGGLGGGFGMLLLPVLLIVIMYFLMIRPEKKREKKQQEKRSQMEIGDHIMTIGGILGKVVNIKDDEVTISTSVANSLLTFRKDAISEVIKPEQAARLAAGKQLTVEEKQEKKGFFSRFKKDE